MRRLPELSKRDRAVLELVQATRLISAPQVERALFPPGTGTSLSAARRARRCLARLHEHGLLRRLDRRLGGARAGSSGYLYVLATGGHRALGLSSRGSAWEPGELFVAHRLAVSQLHVDLVAAERDGRITELRITHEPAVWRRFQSGAAVETLKPDLLVELTSLDDWERRWFVEVDRATAHLPAVVKKCLTYQRYWRSGRETALHEVFPKVLWSVPDTERGRAIQDAIRRTQGLNPNLFSTATAERTVEVLSAPHQSNPSERR